MVTFVRPKSMFLKCRSVIANPGAIVGKDNRSDQVSFGRETVIAISTPAPARNHNHARSLSTTTSSKSGDRHVSNGMTVGIVFRGNVGKKNSDSNKIRIMG